MKVDTPGLVLSHRFKLFQIVFTCIVLLPGVMHAQKGGAKDTPVTSALEGLGPEAVPPPGMYNYRIQGDLRGPYYDGVEKVESILQVPFQGGRDWELDTRYSATRSILIDFRDPVAGSGATPPFSWRYIPTRFIAKGHALGNDIGGMKGVGSEILSPLNLSFDFQRNTYRIIMGSETDFVRISCLGVVGDPNDANSQCNHWKVEPSVVQADGQLKNSAKLTRTASNGAVTDLGNFYFSFLISFTNP